jgi:predicted RNase H-like HicB family nuclease
MARAHFCLSVVDWRREVSGVLTAYLDAAMHRAAYERLEDDEAWFATIAEFPGLWASGKTVEDTRDELRSALEGWIVLALRESERLPIVDGTTITPDLPVRRPS